MVKFSNYKRLLELIYDLIFIPTPSQNTPQLAVGGEWRFKILPAGSNTPWEGVGIYLELVIWHLEFLSIMEIVKSDKAGIKQAVKILKAGGVIVYPTDTAYALGGFFDSPMVIKKVLRIKQRTDRKFTLVAANQQQVEKFFKLSPLLKKIAQQYWPGPLSIVVSRRFAVRVPAHRLAQLLARGAGKPLIATSANISGGSTLYDSRAIIRQFANEPDPAPRAQGIWAGSICNESAPPTDYYHTGLHPCGKAAGYSATHNKKNQPDLIIDAGRLKKTKTSTVVRISTKKITVIRPGAIKVS